jgi:hypothetical protein
MSPIADLTYQLLLIGTYLFLPFTYLLLLSSDIFAVVLSSTTSEVLAFALVSLVLSMHIYTLTIGYLVHKAIQRRKDYAQVLNSNGGVIPTHSHALMRSENE